MKKYLNFMAVSALVGAVFATWAAPYFISILFTPPVSFGQNCEPAAAWSMSSLVNSQLMGVAFGAVLGAIGTYKFSKKSESPKSEIK